MLRIGKLKESVYQRSVEKQFHNEKSFQPLRMHTITVDGWTLAAERLVYNMVNCFAAESALVTQMTVSVHMPRGSEEAELRKFTARLGVLCKEFAIWVSMGEVRVIEGCKRPLCMAVGVSDPKAASMRLPKGEKSLPGLDRQSIKADMDVIVAGSIACEGAAILAIEHESELKERFAAFYVQTAKELYDAAAMPAVQEILLKEKAFGTAVLEGGIFAGLWNMAAAGKVGLDIDLSAIPIKQHTVEVCEFFDLNPYMLLSGGCLLIVASHGASLLSALQRAGIAATIIGRTTSTNDRIIHYDDEIRYLEPPKTDEIYKVS